MSTAYRYRLATIDDLADILTLGTAEGAFPFWPEEELLRAMEHGVVVGGRNAD